MKKNLSKNAFTLIELIVSLVLVAIVILGIFSVGQVLSNNNQDFGQRFLVKSETQTTLNHILNNASLAVGSANNNDSGILLPAAVGDAGTFCIHQAGGNNLIGSASDIWLCYQWYPSGDLNYPYQIRWCAENYPAAAVASPGSVADPRSASSCSTAVTNGTVIAYSGNNTTFLGSARSITKTVGTNLLSSPYFVASGGTQLLFSINILNCLNNAAATCSDTGTSTDPAGNPEVQVSGSIIPLQESM